MFSEWLSEQNDLQQKLTSFFQKVKLQILSSMKAKDGYVLFQFPQDYESLFEQPTAQPQQPYAQQPYNQPFALAAHTLTPGTWINEGDKQEDPYGKGGLAFKSVADKLDWEPGQILTFKKTMQKSIQRIGKEMGLLFELYIYIHLIDMAGLNPIEEDKDSFWAYSVRDQYMEKLQAKVSKASSPLILQFLELHSKDMAQKMKAKAASLLKCPVDSVQFNGGEGSTFTARKTPADIIIGCGQQMVGFNLKFTSETKIHLASLAFHSAYNLLGGRNPGNFQKGVEMAEEGEENQFVLSQLWELAQQYENQPTKFTKMLNYLISGVGEMPVVPAMRNYTRNRGNAEWSGGIELDFIVKNNVLYPKPGATVQVQKKQPRTYVQLTYKVADGTPHGTSIYLEPNQGKVSVKANNFTSMGGRGY